MDIVEFFDIYNYEHLEAYRHLTSTGTWPPSFFLVLQAQNLKFSPGWIFGIQAKLANAHVEQMLLVRKRNQTFP